ncbi:hypothetical protein BDV30DRAFT_233325 [Aspergillus minisclerotigenes]|nr:hypothetical protein BDV30DRAFT_233325 [Aspergillus minisclerotigenes]
MPISYKLVSVTDDSSMLLVSPHSAPRRALLKYVPQKLTALSVFPTLRRKIHGRAHLEYFEQPQQVSADSTHILSPIEGAKMNQEPLSPPSEPTPSPTTNPVPLSSPQRTTPIHPLLPEVRVPGEPLPPHRYHPITCTQIDAESEDIRAQLEQLRQEYTSPEAALRAQEQAAREVKQKMEDAERKREDVQKAMDKKIKERNTEMKVLSKYQEVKVSDIPA